MPRDRTGHPAASRIAAALAATLVALILLAAAGSGTVGAEDDAEPGESIDAANIEPVDLNTATLEALMSIPGMTADLARELVHFRATHGPIRAWSDLLEADADLPAARLLSVRPWLYIGAATPGRELLATLARSVTPTRTRDDASVVARAGWLAGAARVRRTAGDAIDSEQAISAVVRWRPRAGMALWLGDAAPVEGMGLVTGLSGSFAAEPPTGRVAGESPWLLDEATDLRRSPPVPGGRALRGAALDLGGRLTIGSFVYRGGPAAATGDSLPSSPRWHTASVRIGARTDARPSAALALAAWGGRPWLGLRVAGPLGAGTGRMELARDPEGAMRHALRITVRAGRRWRGDLVHAGGDRTFVAPLGFDSARAPATPDDLSTGLNENRGVTVLTLRARVSRRVALEGRLMSRLDPAGLRRAFDRPIGSGGMGVEVTVRGGWALAGDVGMENRGAPGPSSEADAPERRYTGRLTAAWEGARARFRLDWSGRLDVTLGGAADHTIRNARDLLTLRGRWRGPLGSWVGAGMARFDLPSSGSAIVFEERSVGLNPSVTVRGRGRRGHLAVGIRRGAFELGAFLSESSTGDGSPERRAGLSCRLVAGQSE